MPSCKAKLEDLGEGVLEFDGNTIRFYVEVGFFRKEKRIILEIDMADVISVKHSATELVVNWNGNNVNTSIFIVNVEEYKAFRKVYMNIDEAFKNIQEKEQAKERKGIELFEKERRRLEESNQVLNAAVQTVESLFDILINLRGNPKWTSIKKLLENCKKSVSELQVKMNYLNIDLTDLSFAIEERDAFRIAEEDCNVLALINDYFSRPSMEEEGLSQENLYWSDIKNVITAICLLNDIILGALVNDKGIQQEIDELLAAIKRLNEETRTTASLSIISEMLGKLLANREKKTLIKEVRRVFREELEGFDLYRIKRLPAITQEKSEGTV